MEDILYELDYSSGDMGSFPLDAMDTASLLDDAQLVSLKKIQGDLYNIDNIHQDVDHGLFPDLLPLDHYSDPLSLDWMENVDLSHLLDKTTEVQDEINQAQHALPITVQPEDIDLLQSLLQDTSEQLTPPDSPDAQVAPQIDLTDVNFDHQAAWEVINSPLSPQDVENLLSPSSSVEVTPCASPVPSQSPPASSPHSPTGHDLSTIDISSILPEQNVSTKTRPTPYERTSKRKAAVRKQLDLHQDSDHDFSFRANEKLSKRERKKLQNKNAATKYRLKKKQESSLIVSEEKGLEDRNKELRDKVDQLTREISCMKDVLGDIYKGLEAKGRK
ncbi:cyclic AMP-dependent transcription factor ATF-5-like [Liolophura sinensis]|uniref:cyclic AMP-dependent transcription factor ATF-5-like n=1 Tax=Liolophura sinensis TaxID=3198878 RepID=UPI003157FD7F